MWSCACTCIAQFAIADASDMCREMSAAEIKAAGLADSCGGGGGGGDGGVGGGSETNGGMVDEYREVFDWMAVWLVVMAIILVALVMGEFFSLHTYLELGRADFIF